MCVTSIGSNLSRQHRNKFSELIERPSSNDSRWPDRSNDVKQYPRIYWIWLIHNSPSWPFDASDNLGFNYNPDSISTQCLKIENSSYGLPWPRFCYIENTLRYLSNILEWSIQSWHTHRQVKYLTAPGIFSNILN